MCPSAGPVARSSRLSALRLRALEVRSASALGERGDELGRDRRDVPDTATSCARVGVCGLDADASVRRPSSARSSASIDPLAGDHPRRDTSAADRAEPADTRRSPHRPSPRPRPGAAGTLRRFERWRGARSAIHSRADVRSRPLWPGAGIQRPVLARSAGARARARASCRRTAERVGRASRSGASTDRRRKRGLAARARSARRRPQADQRSRTAARVTPNLRRCPRAAAAGSCARRAGRRSPSRAAALRPSASHARSPASRPASRASAASHASARQRARALGDRRRSRVGQVEPAHADRHAVLGQQLADAALTGRDRRGAVAGVAHPCPRIVSDACGVLHRSASRNPNRSRSADGTTSDAGFCVAAHDDHACRAAAGHEVPSSSANSVRCLRSSAPEVERQLVTHHQVQRQPVLAARPCARRARAARDSAPPSRPQLAQQLDRLVDVRAREPLRARRPHRQLDQLAVEQPQPHDGSSAAVATSSDSAALLPAPGSPPISTLRSGSAIATVPPSSSTPTGTGSHSDSRSASPCGHGTDSRPASGSRRTNVTVPRAASPGSRATRTSRSPKDAASCSRALPRPARPSTPRRPHPRPARRPGRSAAARPHRRQGPRRSTRAEPRAGPGTPAAAAPAPPAATATPARPRPPRHDRRGRERADPTAPAATTRRPGQRAAPARPGSATAPPAAPAASTRPSSCLSPPARRIPTHAPAAPPVMLRQMPPTRALGARPFAQPRQLAPLRRVEHPHPVQAVERLHQRDQLARGLITAPAGVARAVEQIVDRHHDRAPPSPRAARRAAAGLDRLAAKRHPRAAVHLPRLRRQPSTRTISPCATFGSPGHRDADDLRLAVAERDQLHAPQHLAVARPCAAPTPRAACPPRTASAARPEPPPGTAAGSCRSAAS